MFQCPFEIGNCCLQHTSCFKRCLIDLCCLLKVSLLVNGGDRICFELGKILFRMNQCSPHPEALGHFLHEEPWHQSVWVVETRNTAGVFCQRPVKLRIPKLKTLTSHHWLYLIHFSFNISWTRTCSGHSVGAPTEWNHAAKNSWLPGPLFSLHHSGQHNVHFKFL